MLLAKKYNTCIQMCAWKSTREVWKALWPHPLLPRENQRHDHGASVLNRAETALRHYHPFLGRIFVSLFILLICQSCVGSQRCALRYAFSMRALPAKLRKSFIKHANQQVICKSAKAFGSLMHKPFSSIFTRIARMLCKSAKNIVITCEKMWWHAMTCDDRGPEE